MQSSVQYGLDSVEVTTLHYITMAIGQPSHDMVWTVEVTTDHSRMFGIHKMFGHTVLLIPYHTITTLYHTITYHKTPYTPLKNDWYSMFGHGAAYGEQWREICHQCHHFFFLYQYLHNVAPTVQQSHSCTHPHMHTVALTHASTHMHNSCTHTVAPPHCVTGAVLTHDVMYTGFYF